MTAAKDARKQRVADNPYTRTQQDARQQQQARGQPATEARGDTRGQRTSATGATARDDQLRPPPAAEPGPPQQDDRTQPTATNPDDQPEIPLIPRWPTPPYKRKRRPDRDLPPTCGVMVAGGIEHLETHAIQAIWQGANWMDISHLATRRPPSPPRVPLPREWSCPEPSHQEAGKIGPPTQAE